MAIDSSTGYSASTKAGLSNIDAVHEPKQIEQIPREQRVYGYLDHKTADMVYALISGGTAKIREIRRDGFSAAPKEIVGEEQIVGRNSLLEFDFTFYLDDLDTVRRFMGQAMHRNAPANLPHGDYSDLSAITVKPNNPGWTLTYGIFAFPEELDTMPLSLKDPIYQLWQRAKEVRFAGMIVDVYDRRPKGYGSKPEIKWKHRIRQIANKALGLFEK